MATIGATLLLSSQMRIEQTKIGPDGTPWEPWAKSTLKKRQRDGTAAQGILKLRGNLMNSLNYQANESSVKVSMGATGRSMDYARIHQLGGVISIKEREQKVYLDDKGWFTSKRKAKKEGYVKIGAYTIVIPARPVLGLSTEDEEDIREIVDDYLNIDEG
jgi:phage virion morphogenesis protein